MANHGRKFARALALAALCLLLGGCATNVSTDKLYALPSLPAEYASLEAEINALLSDGAEHSVEIGSLNAVIQAYYIRVDHSDTLYTMSETDHDLLCKTDTDLAQEVSEES